MNEIIIAKIGVAVFLGGWVMFLVALAVKLVYLFF